MNVFMLGPRLVAFLTLSFGIVVLVKNSAAMLNRLFAFLCLSVFVWALGYSQMYNTVADDAAALFWALLAERSTPTVSATSRGTRPTRGFRVPVT